LWFHTWVLDGTPEKGGGRLRLLFGGSIADKAYITTRLFTGNVQEIYQGKKWVWEISATTADLQCDISIIPTLQNARNFKSGPNSFHIPCWLTGDVEVTPADVEYGKSKSRRRDIRQIQRNNLSYDVTTDKAALSDFFHTMYLPTMESSHADGAILMQHDHMLQRLALGECELLRVTQNGCNIAGSLIAYDDQSPRLWSAGILDADRRYLKMGAGTAIYLFSFQHLLGKGHRRINIGRSRAFLNDGALYFKKRLGLTFTEASNNGFVLRVNALSDGARRCLGANPFVFFNRSKLHAAVFVRADSLVDDAAWTSVWNSNYLPGIFRLVVHAIGDQETINDIQVPRQFSGRMSVRGIVETAAQALGDPAR